VASRGIKTHGRIVARRLGNECRRHGLVGGARPRGRPARHVWRHTDRARPAGCCRSRARSLGDRSRVDSLDTVCAEKPADAAHRHTAPGGNGREAASAGGPSEPSPTLIRRSRRVDLSFAAGSATSVRGGGGGADQTAWRQRTQRCGAAADEDQTFEGSALRGSGSAPSPSGTESPCHPPRTPRCPSPGVRENAANPMSGTGTQQARTPRCGENRRGGEKPRGRNRICCGQAATARRLVARRCDSFVASGSVPGVDRRG